MTSNPATSLISLEKQKLDACAKFLWETPDSIFCAQEVKEIQINGGKSSRTIIITQGAFYVFKMKDSTRQCKCLSMLTVMSLTQIAYSAPQNNPQLSLTYGKEGSFVFQSKDALQIGKFLLTQWNVVTYKVPNVPPIRVDAIEMPTAYKNRPAGLLQTRLIVMAHYYRTKMELKAIKQYKTFPIWDKRPSGPFRLDAGFNPGDAIQAVAHAIAWDTDIMSLVLDGFDPSHLGKFVSTLFAESWSLKRISFTNYMNASSQPFILKAREKTLINELAFKEVKSDLITSLFNGLRDFSGEIKALGFVGCMFRTDALGEIFQMMVDDDDSVAQHRFLRCFRKLTTFRFESVTVDPFPFENFQAMLTKRTDLANISMSSLELEGTDLLQMLVDSVKAPRHIEVNGLRFTLPIDFPLPDTVTFLDVSNSDFHIDTFVSLLNAVVGKPRGSKLPMFFYASGLETRGATTKQLLSPLLPKDGEPSKIYPNLVELNWSRNILSPEDMEALIKFVALQTNLKFLDIGQCLVPRNNPDQSLKQLAAFLKKRPIEGLDLSSDPKQPIAPDLLDFLSNISSVRGLRSLRIVDSQLKDAGIDALMKFVTECQDIEELDVDGFGVSNSSEFIRLYNGLISNSRIVALNDPKREMTPLGLEKTGLPQEVQKMMNALKSKRLPRSYIQRLDLVDRSNSKSGSQRDMDHMTGTEDMSLEHMLSIDDSSLSSQTCAKAINEFNIIMRSMVATMQGRPSERQVDPIQTARLVMDHLVSSKKALKINNMIHAQPGTRLGRRSSARRLTFV